MQVIINVTRTVEYCSIVEMPESEFNRLREELDSDDRKRIKAAETEINEKVDVHDWVEDDFEYLNEFEEYKQPTIT